MGISATFTPGLGYRNGKVVASGPPKGLMVTPADDVRFSRGTTLDEADHMGKVLAMDGWSQYASKRLLLMRQRKARTFSTPEQDQRIPDSLAR